MDYKTQIFNINSSTVIKNITKDSINYLLYNIFDKTKFNFIVNVVNDNFELELTKKEMNFYNSEIQIISFPEWNTIPYDVNSPQLKIQIDRMEAIYKLLNYQDLYKNKKVLLLISKNALAQKVINKKDFSFINLKINQEISLEQLRELLKNNCYNFRETATILGDYSVNNNVVDLITFDNKCYRITLKNNKIESIKSFNPESQISSTDHEEIFVLPVKELIFNENNIQNFKQNYRNLFGTPLENDFLYQNISEKKLYNGIENWLPLFYDNQLESILNYIPSNAIITYKSNLREEINKFLDQVNKYYNLRLLDLEHKENKEVYNPIKPNTLYLNKDFFKSMNDTFLNIVFDINDTIKNEREMSLDVKPIPNFYKESKEVFKTLSEFLQNY